MINFIPKGKTELREYNYSNYCKKNEVYKSFEELIKIQDSNIFFELQQ